MLFGILKMVMGTLIGPLLKIGEKYIDLEKDKERSKAITDRLAIQASEQVRQYWLSTFLGQLTLFLLQAPVALYIAAVFIDSTFPMEWLEPKELPATFKSVQNIVVTGMVGLGAWHVMRRNG